MLNKEEIFNLLKSQEFINSIESFGIYSLLIFGSILTDEFNEESDVDFAVISEREMELDLILDLEIYLHNLLGREIDVIDLKAKNIDLFLMVDILNKNNILYTKDENNELECLYNEIDKVYKENENFFYFRKVDLLS
ncbi:MAG: nucleotidyltransferase family protein [Clostridium sp.]